LYFFWYTGDASGGNGERGLAKALFLCKYEAVKKTKSSIVQVKKMFRWRRLTIFLREIAQSQIEKAA
jgi:hypothetical protein